MPCSLVHTCYLCLLADGLIEFPLSRQDIVFLSLQSSLSYQNETITSFYLVQRTHI